MKINSKDLWNYVNNLATDKKVMFKAYSDDIYFADIYWNGEEFEWEPGQFTSKAFFDPLADFEPIEKDKKIEKLTDIELLGQCDNWIVNRETGKKKNFELNPYIINTIRKNTLKFDNKINELIDEINKLKENK